MYSIGIDIGGTNTDMGLVDSKGSIVRRSNIPTSKYTDHRVYINDVMGCLTAMCREEGIDGVSVANGIEGIGIGAPNGNFYTGCVDNAPNLTMKGVLDFKSDFSKYTDVPVVLSNDANAAAYGEYIYGGAKGLRHFIMFTLGTGVGSGIVVDGQLVHGSTGGAGELGHNILIPNGRDCSCGRKGCLEAYTSARGIVQTYRECCTEAGLTAKEDISCREIGDLAHKGDAVALECWRRTGEWLGLAMANAVSFSAPEAIFLMGGPANVGEPLMVPLRKSFEENLLYIYKDTCKIEMSKLKANEVAILGAAALIHLKR